MKKRCTIEELRQEIATSVRTSAWADGYCCDCAIPQPYRIPHDGIANWTVNISSVNKPGCESLMLEIVDRLRHERDLPRESLGNGTEVALMAEWRIGHRRRLLTRLGLSRGHRMHVLSHGLARFP